mgnify:CR=1 FL=1
MLGTDFPYQQFYPDNAKVVQVDIRGRNLGRRTPIDLGLVGTVQRHPRRAAAAAAAEESARPPRPLAAALPQDPQDAGRAGGQRPRPHPDPARNTLPGLLNQLAADDAVFTVDVGSPVVWAARYLRMNGRQPTGRLVQPRHHGVRAAARDRRADRVPRPSGGRAGRRRRSDDAVRRADHADPEPVAGQGDLSSTTRR